MKAHNSTPNIKRRAMRAKRFPANTCPASRHAFLIAEAIQRGEDHFMLDSEDADLAAGSLYSVLESLWKARTELAKIKGERK